MSGPVDYRIGAGDELDEVMATMDHAFDPAYGEAWTRAQCLGMLTIPGVWLTLARDDDGPVGFALARVTADEAELLLLAVLPAHRRRRIGAALLATVQAQAAERGARKLFLEVRDGNPARALYETAGFRQVGCRRAYYRGADGSLRDAYTLERLLAGD